MVVPSHATASLYPSNWPDIPFHGGEVAVQKKLGVHDKVMTYGPSVIRPYMPDQHQDFYRHQPFLVVAARDSKDQLWSTLLFASSSENVASFVESPNSQSLVLNTRPLPGDALEEAFQAGSDLGILGIEFAARRRNRVNGRVKSNDGTSIVFEVDQSFGNCPQYIKARDWWTVQSSAGNHLGRETNLMLNESSVSSRPHRLTSEQIDHIKNATTIFVATGYRGEGEDPTFGNDASHRGGTAGFLKVSDDGGRIFLPDYAGNNMYMSLGNLVKDTRMGVTVPLYETGGMIQMTGTTTIHWEEENDGDGGTNEVSLSDFPGALRWLEFHIDEVVEMPAGSLPIRWDAGKRDLQLQVYDKVEESDDVTSFYLAPVQGDSPISSHLPGQHLTLTLPITSGGSNQESSGTISRSYSISNYQHPKDHEDPIYRISVRRDPFGVGSSYLHDRVEVGDLIGVQPPSGDFYYDPKTIPESSDIKSRTILFLSAGIGVTPLLAMLHAFVGSDIRHRHKGAIWVHTARNGRHDAFKNEVETLRGKMSLADATNGFCTTTGFSSLQTFTAYTRPHPEQDDPSSFDLKGRIDVEALTRILSRAGVNYGSTVDVYMCGPNSFVASMEEALNKFGVQNINYETF